eukprot:Platyproteum_vivax@DN6874_c0_g1_i1.p1
MSNRKINNDIVLSGTDFKLQSKCSYSDRKAHSNIHNPKKVEDGFLNDMIHRSAANALPTKQPLSLNSNFLQKGQFHTQNLENLETLIDKSTFLNQGPVYLENLQQIWTEEVPTKQLSEVKAAFPCPDGSSLFCLKAPYIVANCLLHVLLFQKPSEVVYNVAKYMIKGVGFLASSCTSIKFKIRVLADGDGTCVYFSRRSSDGLYFASFVGEMQEVLSAYVDCSFKKKLNRLHLFDDGFSTDAPSDTSTEDLDEAESVDQDEVMGPIREMALSGWTPHVHEALTMLAGMVKQPKHHSKLCKLSDVYCKLVQSQDVSILYPTLVLLTQLVQLNAGLILEEGFTERLLEKGAKYPHVVQRQLAKFIHVVATSGAFTESEVDSLHEELKRVHEQILAEDGESCEKAVCEVVCLEIRKAIDLLSSLDVSN